MDSIFSVGALAALPPELRLLIWEYLFAFDSDESSRPHRMAILHANRTIYNEISDCLYRKINVVISPLDNNTILMSPQQLRIQWNVMDGNSKKLQFEHLPYHRIHLSIHLKAPLEPVDLILLWQKTNVLVNILRLSSCFKSVDIIFEKHHGQDWQQKENTKGQWLDHNIVFMPFCLLCNVHQMSVIPSSPQMEAVDWGFINYGQDFILHNGFQEGNYQSIYQENYDYRDLVCIFDNIESLIFSTKLFLDTKLDIIPGKKANILRLKRYATWFLGGGLEDSPYQDFILTVLRFYPETVKIHDPGLVRLLNRFDQFIWLHHHLCRWRSRRHRVWDQRKWYQAFPEGISELAIDLKRRDSHYFQMYRSVYAASPKLSKISFFLFGVRRWLTLQRTGFRPRQRRRYDEWCRDCYFTGFTYGCDVCYHQGNLI